MKLTGRLIALGMVCALIMIAPWAMKTAVVDVRERIQPRTEQWEGLVSAAVVPSFPTMNARGWLNACFRAFERQEGNVLISLREMSKVGVQTGAAAGTLPDVLFFGLNVFDEPDTLFVQAESECTVKAGLEGAGIYGAKRYAVPVALGGYALLGNRKLLDQAGWSPQLQFSETMALLQEKQLSVAMPQMEYTNPLAAFQSMGEFIGVNVCSTEVYAKVWPDFALEEAHALYVATQREIQRMQVLQSAGRGFETVLIVPDDGGYTDQVLLCAAVKPSLTAIQDDDAARMACIGRLIGFLLEEEQQRGISQAGLFPVTAVRNVYEPGTQMAQIEQALSGEIALPEPN